MLAIENKHTIYEIIIFPLFVFLGFVYFSNTYQLNIFMSLFLSYLLVIIFESFLTYEVKEEYQLIRSVGLLLINIFVYLLTLFNIDIFLLYLYIYLIIVSVNFLMLYIKVINKTVSNYLAIIIFLIISMVYFSF